MYGQIFWRIWNLESRVEEQLFIENPLLFRRERCQAKLGAHDAVGMKQGSVEHRAVLGGKEKWSFLRFQYKLIPYGYGRTTEDSEKAPG